MGSRLLHRNCHRPVDRISWYRARLFPVPRAFSISRAFDGHQSYWAFLQHFTTWRLRDLRAPLLLVVVDFLSSVIDSDLDDILIGLLWRAFGPAQVDTIQLCLFFGDGGLACFLLTSEGLKGNKLSSVQEPWRARNQAVCTGGNGSHELWLSTKDNTTSPIDYTVARALVVWNLAAFGLTSPPRPSWQTCTLRNKFQATVSLMISTAFKPDHHIWWFVWVSAAGVKLIDSMNK
ncbi:hypothetical protein CSKR_103626 [Clonorchis sinensis]|uniref:Uncharacterized protein n=1 Tax=Clonorchis sinensis TaxID=79923 RepID=A0A419PKM7_CLOSI|nr:hypothetical protein CSKR_103626 [Clonorchis sinensis]